MTRKSRCARRAWREVLVPWAGHTGLVAALIASAALATACGGSCGPARPSGDETGDSGDGSGSSSIGTTESDGGSDDSTGDAGTGADDVGTGDTGQPPEGFWINGEAEGDRSSRGVAGAGDLDQDGLDDLLVAAPWAHGGEAGSGRVYVVFGRTTGETVELTDVAAGVGGFVINGEAEDDKAGLAVDGAGDVNGDGFGDVVIGARGADGTATNSGRAYVVWGPAAANAVQLSDIASGTGGFVIEGEAVWEEAGTSVSRAGDVNGDSLDDVIVGSLMASPGGNYSGRAYVVLGKEDAAPVELSDVALGVSGFALDGEAGDDFAGGYVGGGGDVNGDGLDDVLVGAAGSDANGVDSGRVYVVFGKVETETTSLSAIAAGDGGFVIDGEDAYDTAGAADMAGDVNDDGFDDIIVGASEADTLGFRAGRAYVVFGKSDGEVVSLADVADGVGGFVINPEREADELGSSVGGAGDLNGDGLTDLIVGAPFAGETEAGTGRAYVVYGKKDTVAVELADVVAGSGGFSVEGEADEDQMGRSVSSGGDVNGDGIIDVIVGAPFADPSGPDSGQSYVRLGR